MASIINAFALLSFLGVRRLAAAFRSSYRQLDKKAAASLRTPTMRIAVLSTLLLAGCATAPAPVPGPPVSGPQLAEICEAPERQLGSDRAALIARLGKPQSEQVVTLPNRHVPGVMDRRVTLRFGGVEVLIHEVPEYDRSFLAQTRLTANHPALQIPLRIGDSTDRAHELLGSPTTSTSQKLEFTCPSELGATLNVSLQRGRVTQLQWLTEPD